MLCASQINMKATFKLFMSVDRLNDTSETKVFCERECVCVCAHTRTLYCFSAFAFACLPNAAVPFLSILSLCCFSQSQTPPTTRKVNAHTFNMPARVCATSVCKEEKNERTRSQFCAVET